MVERLGEYLRWSERCSGTGLQVSVLPGRFPLLQQIDAGVGRDPQQPAAEPAPGGIEPGHMLEGYPGEPHDGVYALQRYCRRVCLQLGSLTDGLSSFEDLLEQPKPILPEDTPVIHKEDYISKRVPDEFSELFFKSGGTSGKPKMAVYTYEDYKKQMLALFEKFPTS